MSGIKAIVAGHEKTITQVPMLVNGVDKGWEVRTGDGELLWGAKRTITGTTPMTLKGYGIPLDACNIIGNTQQTGTPSPDNIIMPTFCGVRTGNLCNVSNANTLTYTSSYNNFLIDDNTQSIATTGNVLVGFLVPVEPSTTYTVYASSTEYGLIRVREYSEKPSEWAGAEYIQQQINSQCGYAYNFTTTAQTKWIAVAFYFDLSHAGAVISNIMLSLGSTARPYEPYGYKIPITNAGQTTPVYLGQTQTVRRVKKLVLDGTEEWTEVGANYIHGLYIDDAPIGNYEAQICSHFIHASSWLELQNTNNSFGISSLNRIVIHEESIRTTADFKSYLATQYAAGTPVTVWYVLATPETGIVNEPLAKIGDYADELNSADAAVTIPTINGQNTLTIDSELQPSQISVTGHIKSIS